MAKSGRPGTRQPTGQGKGQPAGQGKARPDVPKPVPATPGGPNRQARKEEARRQREALQRKMSRRRYYRFVGAVVAVLFVAAAVTGVVIYQSGALKRAARAASCGLVRTIAPYSPAGEDRTHIGTQGSPVKTAPPLSSYPSTPPASGPHLPAPLAAGVYTSPPSIYNAIHSLEHGAVEIWYPPSAAGSSELAKIQDFYRQSTEKDHIIVAPYDYPSDGAAGALPAGGQMVLVAWHHMQTCAHLNLPAAQLFVKSYRTTTGTPVPCSPPGYKGDAPEACLTI